MLRKTFALVATPATLIFACSSNRPADDHDAKVKARVVQTIKPASCPCLNECERIYQGCLAPDGSDPYGCGDALETCYHDECNDGWGCNSDNWCDTDDFICPGDPSHFTGEACTGWCDECIQMLCS
jgi:hypothetical protein